MDHQEKTKKRKKKKKPWIAHTRAPKQDPPPKFAKLPKGLLKDPLVLHPDHGVPGLGFVYHPAELPKALH